MNTLEKKYICKYCSLEFDNHYKLAAHIGSCHKCNQKCKCDICGKEFNKKYSLTYHINAKHLKTIDIKHGGFLIKKQCPKCGKEITAVNFNKHLKACGHQKQLNKDVMEILSKCIVKDNKYICPICNKEYSKMGIATHIWRKHTEKGLKFESNCDKGYKDGTRVAWNKGLTKETDERVRKGTEKLKESWKLGKCKYSIPKDKEKWIEKLKKAGQITELTRSAVAILIDKVIVYSADRVEIRYRFESAFETMKKYVDAYSQKNHSESEAV